LIRPDRHELIRALFDEYIEKYAGRDDSLTEHFSENFSGCTGGGDFLVKDRDAWVKITRQDFSEVPGRIRIDMLDLALQDLSDDVVMSTAFFRINLPLRDSILSRETARLVLVFRREGEVWKIVSSTISIPYHLVQTGEVYPLSNLQSRNRELEVLVEERTRELEAMNAKLETLSNTDGLTGVANRRRFDCELGREWNRNRRTGQPLALIMLDVDHFKHYNDCLGHLAGDSCLKALAETLERMERRAGRMVARYGGEEFVVLLPDTDLRGAQEAARRIQREIWALALPHPDMPRDTAGGIVTVSLGVASLVPAEDNSPECLVREADAALYKAKNAGRNRIWPNAEEPA
jgi:diguanylate cyclase (GGDEF)-like protein